MSTTPKTFKVEVENVGTFTFRARDIRAQGRIEGETDRLLGGEVSSDLIYRLFNKIAELMVLTVAAPDGWDLSAIDPLDPEQMAGVYVVHGRFTEEEARFRGKPLPARAAVRAGDGADVGVRVPPAVPAAAD